MPGTVSPERSEDFLTERCRRKLVVCGLSSSPFIDLAGAKMLHDLHGELASHGIAFQIVGARGQVRDVLQADGLAEKPDSANWTRRMDSLLGDLKLS